jgi:aconitate hydratase
VTDGNIVGCAVLSGNRNFEGRIHPMVQMNFLASPPLVVAYALAGTMGLNLLRDSLGDDASGNPVYLRDIWPSQKEIQECIVRNIDSGMFKSSYGSVFDGDANWNSLDVPRGEIYSWDPDSTYVKNPPYFEGMTLDTRPLEDIRGARVLALLGDSVTTDHISPAGSISAGSPAAQYLRDMGVEPVDFNSYGSRRGNHEVMMRGTFANIRLRNQLAPGTEGGWTLHQPSDEQLSIYDASLRYQKEGTPLVVIAGSEYGSGSSRDWAAKGTLLLGVKAVIAVSYERIHRSNLIGMGVLPLQFADGGSAQSLGLTGKELFDIAGIADGKSRTVSVTATRADGERLRFDARVRIDTPKERDYFEHGGILHYMLRQLATRAEAA